MNRLEPPRGPRSGRLRLAALIALGVLGASVPSQAQVQIQPPSPYNGYAAYGQVQSVPARQLTVVGVLAVPGGDAVDPKLIPIAPQLRRLLPNHSFRLLRLESKRVQTSQSVLCDLGEGYRSETQLLVPLDPNGKVRMRFELSINGISQYQTIVVTPPDQLFFCDKLLPNGSRLLIGMGAR